MRFTILAKLFTVAVLAGTIGAPMSGTDARQETLTPLSKPPIATRDDELGDLLRKWYSNGTAAGNIGDYYDNRDGGHSLLNLQPYPQLQKVEYTEQEKKTRQDWGFQQKVLPYVVFGNSSTSASPDQGGSNVRRYYVDPRGLAFLFTQYTHNNLYIYPEHQDHDPGHNGIGGYGDLFPTNTPYLIASQGSSGSDQPFMQAIPYVLAAFQPEVKKRLIQSGLLMPAVQMILRYTSKALTSPKEYLTGKAHPTVFEGSNVDTPAMVEMAHRITASQIPPIAVLRIVREDLPAGGIDYFEPEHTEKLGDTPVVIARVFRGSKHVRKMVVSAEESRDLNNRPLKFYWTVLRGDPGKVNIEYLNSSRSVAEVTFAYHERKRINEESNLESNRVDIGVFVHNGAYYSPPAFITSFALDNEARQYRSDGRLLEIAYGTGSSTISVDDWSRFFDVLNPLSESWQNQFLCRQFTADEISDLQEAAEAFRRVHATLLQAQEILKAPGKTSADAAAARKTIQDAQESEKQVLQKKTQRLKTAAADLVQRALDSLLEDPNLWGANKNQLEALCQSASRDSREAFNQIRAKLIAFGVAENTDSAPLQIRTLSRAEGSITGGLTRFEKGVIERLNGVVLSRILFPGIVESRWRENYVDPRITSAKEWRDVYRYSPDGTPGGWRRYEPGGVLEFNAEGLLVLERDSRGRCTRARVVRYEVEPQNSSPARNRVKLIQTDTIREYEYDGPNDWKGRVKH